MSWFVYIHSFINIAAGITINLSLQLFQSLIYFRCCSIIYFHLSYELVWYVFISISAHYIMFSFLFIVVWCLCVGSRVFISAFLQLVSLCHVWRYPTGENSFHFIWHHIVSDVCFIYNIQQSRCMDTCIQVSFLEKWFMWSFLYFYYIFFHLRIASEVSFSSLCVCLLYFEVGGWWWKCCCHLKLLNCNFLWDF
jgi:hypothetical protein